MCSAQDTGLLGYRPCFACCFNEPLVASSLMYCFVLQINAFEVASDAFSTFEKLLKKHEAVADFLNQQFQRFFTQYEQLLQSDANYATQRQVRVSLSHVLRLCVAQPNVAAN
jgi:hypothetical protein